jgi:hydroxypyruvate reductase
MTQSPTHLETLHADAAAIFDQALKACDIATAFGRHLHFDGKTLVRHPSPLLNAVSIALDKYKRFLVISLGKAGLTMMDSLLVQLPEKMLWRGVCSAPEVPKKHSWRVKYFAGGHPLPNEASFAAAREALKLLKQANKDTFIFFLISGGGSAMMELPRDPRISLDDTIAFHETLVSSGAGITEINTVRKYFSAVKGGRLALAAPEAAKLSLLLADVPLKDLGAVASSPTLPDHSTPAECLDVLLRFHLLEKFPQAVREYFEQLHLESANAERESPETQQAFANAQFDVLLSNHDFVNAARDHAQSLGYKVVIDNSCDDWDYRDASAYLMKRFHELRREFPRLCLLSSGEVTVHIDGPSGCGGRNQQFALTAAFDLEQHAGEPLAVLSAGSDGIDGNSPAAGAIADPTTLRRARDYGFDPQATLDRFDTCPLFTALGDTVMTGPTGNNLRDLRVLLASG